jgi:hypothetical protein
MKRRRPSRVDRELYDGNVCIGKRVHEHRPRTVIETPREIQRRFVRLEQRRHALR